MPLEETAIGPVMNCSTFRRRAGNNAKYIREHIDLFQSVYPRQLQQAHHAARRNDAEGLRLAARALKSTLGTFEAEPAMRAAAALEEKGCRGDLSGIDEFYGNVEFEVERLCDTLMTFDMGGGQ